MTRRQHRATGAVRAAVPRTTLALPLLGVLVLVFVLATGCGGDDDPTPSREGAAPAVAADHTAPTLRDAASALDALDIGSCPSGDGRVEATGDLRNVGTTLADYVVTVSWLDADGGVVDTDFAVVENVAPRQRKSWTVAATLDQSAASCTTRVSRGRL